MRVNPHADHRRNVVKIKRHPPGRIHDQGEPIQQLPGILQLEEKLEPAKTHQTACTVGRPKPDDQRTIHSAVGQAQNSSKRSPKKQETRSGFDLARHRLSTPSPDENRNDHPKGIHIDRVARGDRLHRDSRRAVAPGAQPSQEQGTANQLHQQPPPDRTGPGGLLRRSRRPDSPNDVQPGIA